MKRAVTYIAGLGLLLTGSLMGSAMLNDGSFARIESATIDRLIIATGIDASDVVRVPRPEWIDTSLAAGELSSAVDGMAAANGLERPYSTGEALTVVATQW